MCELYDKLIGAGANDYFEKQQLIDVVSDTSSYRLPDDYYKTLGVDVKLSNGNYVNVGRYNHALRNKYSIYRVGAVSREWSEYRIRGENIVLVPEPNWTQSEGIRHIYAPVCPELLDDNDTFDFVNGWEDWVVYDCIIKFVGGKEEGDASQFERMLARVDRRIERLRPRDRANPDQIRDIDLEETERVWPRYGSPP